MGRWENASKIPALYLGTLSKSMSWRDSVDRLTRECTTGRTSRSLNTSPKKVRSVTFLAMFGDETTSLWNFWLKVSLRTTLRKRWNRVRGRNMREAKEQAIRDFLSCWSLSIIVSKSSWGRSGMALIRTLWKWVIKNHRIKRV